MSCLIFRSELHRQPPHHSGADHVSQGVLPVPVIQGVEHRHGHFGLAAITGRRWFLPEAIGPTQIQEMVTPDVRIWRNDAKGLKVEKRLIQSVGGRSDPMIGELTTQPVFPLGSEAGVVFESGSGPSGGTREGLADLLIGEVAEPTQPRGREQFDAGFASIDIGDALLKACSPFGSDEIGEMVIKECRANASAMLEVPPLILKLIGSNLFRSETTTAFRVDQKG